MKEEIASYPNHFIRLIYMTGFYTWATFDIFSSYSHQRSLHNATLT